MPNADAVITLTIKETPSAGQRIFIFHVQVDGEVVGANKSLSPADSKAMRDLSVQYNALFEKHYAPGLVADDLRVFGGHLFNTWLAEAWPAIKAKVKPGARRVLVIASDVPAILNLP